MTLSKGDCLFIPSFWWFQLQVADADKLATTFEHSLLIRYGYDVSSTWVDLIMYGTNNSLL